MQSFPQVLDLPHYLSSTRNMNPEINSLKHFVWIPRFFLALFWNTKTIEIVHPSNRAELGAGGVRGGGGGGVYRGWTPLPPTGVQVRLSDSAPNTFAPFTQGDRRNKIGVTSYYLKRANWIWSVVLVLDLVNSQSNPKASILWIRITTVHLK